MWNNRPMPAAAVLAGLLLVGAPDAAAQALQGASIVEHVGAALPRDVTFTDSSGRSIVLGSLLGGKPVVISLAYFSCPMLCPMGQDGAADVFRDSGWRLGDDFRAVTVSIDPRDRPETAQAWRSRAAARMGLPLPEMDWTFVVGQEPNIRRLTDAIGFDFAYDPASTQYSHAAALFIVTADGRLSRYVYGITFEAASFAESLRAARANQSGGPVERFLMRCFHYVPSLRRHGSFVVWLLRCCGLAVVAGVGSLLVVLWRRETRHGAVQGVQGP